jgi:threonine aldolase
MRYIDIRSDTVTLPTQKMREAMYKAEVGDDVYEDDPTVKRLEKLAAEMVGKEAALFVPSGTFGNELALLTHTKRGDEVIVDRNSHIVLHEVGASAVIAGVQLREYVSHEGIPNVDEIEALIRDEDIHYPPTTLICLENAHGMGKVMDLESMDKIKNLAHSRNVKVHLDGARIFNAACALGVEAKDIASRVDSVMFCLSKGLAAPVGSMLAGTREFIDRARKGRKLMGGGMRQVGFLAAAGIVALEEMVDRLYKDHENADFIARKLDEFDEIEVQKTRRDINMVFFKFLVPIDDKEFVSHMLKNGIKINPPEGGEYRFVTNKDVSRKDLQKVVEEVGIFLENTKKA